MFQLTFAVFCASICTLLVLQTQSYSITIETKTKQCFIVVAETSSTITGSFEVITGDSNEVLVTVEGPPPTLHKHFESKYLPETEKDLSEGDFSFSADKDGEYKLCFSSNDELGGDGLPAIVAFNYRSLSSGEQDYHYKGLENELNELRQGLDSLKDHEAYMSQREDIHEMALESINFKVLFWTVLEAIILIGMAVFQVSYISSFFEVKRKL